MVVEVVKVVVEVVIVVVEVVRVVVEVDTEDVVVVVGHGNHKHQQLST